MKMLGCIGVVPDTKPTSGTAESELEERRFRWSAAKEGLLAEITDINPFRANIFSGQMLLLYPSVVI
jgi:hypothetical protein